MGFLSHRVDRDEIEAGDHIYTWRSGYTYSHHGIYIGGNMVVHFTCEPISSLDSGIIAGSSFNSSASCSKNLPACPIKPDCGFHKPESGVMLSCLDCFLVGGSLYRFEYGISVPVFMVKLRGGTCTTAKSDAPEVVIRRTMHLLHNGFGNYDVFKNNCEDFAIYCKTGLLIHDQSAPGRSGQVTGNIGAPLVAVILSSPLRLFMSNPIGIATAGIGFYSWSRYASDIGVRSDVIKIEEEDMVSFYCSEGSKEPTKDVQCSEGSKEPTKDVQCRKRFLNMDEGDFPTSKRQMPTEDVHPSGKVNAGNGS